MLPFNMQSFGVNALFLGIVLLIIGLTYLIKICTFSKKFWEEGDVIFSLIILILMTALDIWFIHLLYVPFYSVYIAR